MSDTAKETGAAPAIELQVVNAPSGSIPETPEPNLLDNVLSRLGVSRGKKEDTTAKPKVPVSAKLNKVQEQFCETVTPICGSLLIMSLAWAWARAGSEYRALAPSKETAEAIVGPLVRIYARSNKTMVGAVSPNTADALLSLNACIMYLFSALKLMEEINKEKARDGTEETPPPGANTRRPAPLSSNGQHASSHVASGHDSPLTNLNERERQNYERLNLLRQQDIESRTRRQGNNGSI